MNFILNMIIPLSVGIFTIFSITTIKQLVEDYRLKQLVLRTVKAVEQSITTEDSYHKFEVVKDYVINRVDIEEEDLNILIESTIYEINQVK